MISYLIVTGLIIISLIYTKKYGLLGFVLLVALIGSDTDSVGILYAIESFFPYYKIIIRGFTIFLYIYSIFKITQLYLNGSIKSSFFFFYLVPLVLLSFTIFFVNIARGVDSITALSEIIWLGIPFFFIWTLGIIRSNNSHEIFVKIIQYQSMVTLLILLLGPLTAEINGVSYAYIIGGDYWQSLSQTVINARISFGDFSKHSLNTLKFAQFHNPNSLGVYSTTYIAVALLGFIQKRVNLNGFILSIFLLLVGVVGWFNSLTRGPIFFTFLILIFYLIGIFIRPKTFKRVFLLLFIGFILIINIDLIVKMIQHFMVNSSNLSIISRLSGISFAFNSIVSSPIWGVMPELSDPIPHILPLKIGAYYGLPALILITIPFFHVLYFGSKSFLRDILNGNSENSLFHIILVGIIFGAYLTNGVIVYVLFWVLLAESIKNFNIIKKP